MDPSDSRGAEAIRKRQ